MSFVLHSLWTLSSVKFKLLGKADGKMLFAATWPVRDGPASGVPGVTAAISAIPKQSGYLQSQGHLQSSTTTTASQDSSGPGGNLVVSTTAGSLGTHSLHGAAMLAAAGRQPWHCS
ncbi:hypothetical protein F0562_019689 [Nyssa sinensis]|uniref:Uncharacterized protein n=1 Tax=Nyssa sinensis TaxID=561372 RepID=A0A5J5BQL3_9ASTE|nr:hypothetical protein F0562_019689 [Nyssa sinensis]